MKGLIDWFADNHVAANLLMIFLVLAGIISALTIKQELFPEIDLDMVSVSIVYLGASPEEVEESVCIRVEEAIESIDGIKRITSLSVEGSGMVMAEINTDADAEKVLDDIKQAVDQIITFPEETERPVINLMESSEQAIDIVIHGDADEKTLKVLADRVRDDLLADGVVTQAQLVGTRPYEISIEIGEDSLRRYGLSFDAVTDAVRRGSLDMPGGSVKTDAGEILVRTKGQRYSGDEFAGIAVLTRPDGTRLTLGEVADIRDDFQDVDTRTWFDGSPASVVSVYRVSEQGILEVTDSVHEYVRNKSDSMPEGVEIGVWADRSDIYRGRMNLMLKNGAIGLVLVFFCLSLFLQPRLAFWVALGIPISFLGGFWIIPGFGASLNMISMFALIIVLGLVVDDAIVVGENIFTHREKGETGLRASVIGTREVAAPVIIAILTTIFAFFPLSQVEGMMGKFMGQVPVVVIAVLVVSLVEALFILPAHLSTIPRSALHLDDSKDERSRWSIGGLQGRFSRSFKFFIDRSYRPTLEYAAHHRGVVLAAAVAIILLLAGFVGGGHIRFTFMPKIDSDNMLCVIDMPAGTTLAQTDKVVGRIEAALEELRSDVDGGRDDAEEPIIRHVLSTIGFQPRGGGANRPGTAAETTFLGSHKAEINVELLAGEKRSISSNELVTRWRELTGPLTGAKSVTFTSNLFHGSAALQLQLSSEDSGRLTAAAARLEEILEEYPGVQDIRDSYEEGKVELKLSLLPEARTLGLTLQDMARQVRQGFYGDEAMRIQRGRDDVRVMVRYPRGERRSVGDLENMMIRTPAGTEIPFRRVAIVETGRGYASVDRVDRRRIVNVEADVDQNVTNAGEVLADMQKQALPDLLAEFPGLRVSFEGEERDRAESLESMRQGFLVALLAIYALLAVLFRSYAQPVIIMSAIPFGFVGAVLGHVLMGWDLTLLSMFGVVALTGVVVNDSLIMIDFINRCRAEGMGLNEAVLASGVRRFRPIVLTSLTTFAGLTPMLLEKSLQARFLIPMAISLGFGVLFATVITLVLVPVGYLLMEDAKRLLGLTSNNEGPGKA